MPFNFLIKDSAGWTLVFAVLGVIALITQVGKTTFAKSVPENLRHLLKAAPALFLAGLSLYLHGPLLLTAAFLFCAAGDIFLDFTGAKASSFFKIGAGGFAAALVCLSLLYLGKPSEGHLFWPLCLTNVAIAAFVVRCVLPNLTGTMRILELCYFAFLVTSNIIASTTTVPVFLGSSLWLMSDLSIGLGDNVLKKQVNSLDTLGLYDVGLYFIAIGFLNP